MSWFSPIPSSSGHHPQPDHTAHARPVNDPATRPAPTPDATILYTPTQAAQQLQVSESWLRCRAAARTIPCTFLGKHLRFSAADLTAIVTQHARPATGKPARRPRRRAPSVRDGDLPAGPDQSVDASRPDDHQHNGSNTWPG
jgi:excisionase family DNA binding protein